MVISSSCSTNETVVADSDEELESAMPVDAAAASHDVTVTCSKQEEEPVQVPSFGRKEETSIYRDASKLDDTHISSIKDDNITSIKDDSSGFTRMEEKIQESENGKSDIIYSQVLIVRGSNLPSGAVPEVEECVPNFKCFRKIHTHSGNSFSNLVPFSKYPYKESDHESELVESMKEEKKRKQMEAVAEELFNSEKGRRRGLSGSLYRLLSRG